MTDEIARRQIAKNMQQPPNEDAMDNVKSAASGRRLIGVSVTAVKRVGQTIAAMIA